MTYNRPVESIADHTRLSPSPTKDPAKPEILKSVNGIYESTINRLYSIDPDYLSDKDKTAIAQGKDMADKLVTAIEREFSEGAVFHLDLLITAMENAGVSTDKYTNVSNQAHILN